MAATSGPPGTCHTHNWGLVVSLQRLPLKIAVRHTHSVCAVLSVTQLPSLMSRSFLCPSILLSEFKKMTCRYIGIGLSQSTSRIRFTFCCPGSTLYPWVPRRARRTATACSLTSRVLTTATTTRAAKASKWLSSIIWTCPSSGSGLFTWLRALKTRFLLLRLYIRPQSR